MKRFTGMPLVKSTARGPVYGREHQVLVNELPSGFALFVGFGISGTLTKIWSAEACSYRYNARRKEQI